jgi:hypothetical protein
MGKVSPAFSKVKTVPEIFPVIRGRLSNDIRRSVSGWYVFRRRHGYRLRYRQFLDSQINWIKVPKVSYNIVLAINPEEW